MNAPDVEAKTLVPLDTVAGASIEERFEAFHRLNPWVLTALERLTTRYLAAGHSRCGIAMLVERLRWEHDTTTSGDAFKFNNDYRSRYVRLMIDRHPEWSSVFATRELVTA